MAVDDIDAGTLMPLETPVLKVSRPVAACSRCRNAKIKCDGKLPACSSCEKNGRAAECTSTNDQFARGKERSYVSTLETRIDKLQAKLEEARARKPSVISIPDDETTVPSRRPSYSAQGPATPNSSKSQRRKEASAIDDLVSDFGYLSVNATARDFYGFTSAMSYARLILSACSKDQLPQGMTKALPPRYAATALIQHYLNNVFVLLPVFDESSFYGSVDALYSRNDRNAQPLDHWMVRMVLAISSASMSEQRGDQHYLEGIGHVCAALEHAEIVLHPGAISSVQALVLLTEYAMLDPHHLDSWSLIGAASRAMVDLGIHQDPPKGTSMSKGKLELRRRIFHCVYALDRSTSLVQTRAFSFSDDSAKVKIPFSKAPPNHSTSSNGHGLQKAWLQPHEQALDLINLRQLQSTWYTDLFQSGRSAWDEPYQYIWSTCDSMRRWFESLSVTTNPNMRAFFELDLLYSYVYVLSPSPRVPVINPFAAKLIFEYCIRYGELMLRLISDPSYSAPLTFYDAMRVYMTGRQFLDVLQHNTDPLLNGNIPPHPEVKPTAAPPPAMPVVPLPPGDTLQHFNTVRSIHCIKQITECLSRFGIRWGYMSWNQRYLKETSGMLEDLNRRLRELDSTRRPSISAHSSNGGSIGFHSPQSLPPGPAAYRQPSMTAFNMTSYGEPIRAPQVSPQYHYQDNPFPQQPIQPFVDQQQYFQQPSGQPFGLGNQQYQYPAQAAAPGQQFATWGGYGGPSAPDTLDEENAAVTREPPPESPNLYDSPSSPSPTSELPPRATAQDMHVGQATMPAMQGGDTHMQTQQAAVGEQNSPQISPDDSRAFDSAGGRPAPTVGAMNSMQARQRKAFPLQSQQIPAQPQSSDESSDEGIMLAHSSRIGATTQPPSCQPQEQPILADQSPEQQQLSKVRQWQDTLQKSSSGESSDGAAASIIDSRPTATMQHSDLLPLGQRSTTILHSLQSQQAMVQHPSSGESSDSQRLEIKTSRPSANTSQPQGGLTNWFDPSPPRTSRTTLQEPSVGRAPLDGRPKAMTSPTPLVRGRSPLRSQLAIGYEASGETSPGSLGTLKPTGSRSENLRPAPQPSAISDFSIPPTCNLPPLTGTGPAPPLPESEAAPTTRRRSSMQDFVLELAEEAASDPLAGTGLSQQRQPEAYARVFRPPRERCRDQTPQAANTTSRFAGDDGYFHPEEHAGFALAPGIGYCCLVCGQAVQQPQLHSSNGMWCFDANWDPSVQALGTAPPGVDVQQAIRQSYAGKPVVYDFAPKFNQPSAGWDHRGGRH
ncbi:hypothetical protein LTR65_004843 [Meristemomyces frigidus]